MRLNHFTDFSMRVLMYLDQKQSASLSSLDELADTFKISRNHLIKVVQFLATHELIYTKRGKNGGISISEKTQSIGLGTLIHLLEQDEIPVIDCNAKPCIFQSHNCKLKSLFGIAYHAFIDSLNQHKLSDLKINGWEQLFNTTN